MKFKIINFCLLNISLLTNSHIFLTSHITKNNQSTNYSNAYLYEYSRAEMREQKRESEIYHKYYSHNLLSPYRDFIFSTENYLKRHANEDSIKKFDQLYDEPNSTKIWANFNDLNETLTTHQLSQSVTLNLDWVKLYQSVNLSSEKIESLKMQQLRFYNIICKLYGSKNILRLVQKIEINNQLELFAHSEFDPVDSAAIIQFNGDLCNQTVINYQFNRNHIASKSLIVDQLHEYCQMLIYYVYNDSRQRKAFNQIPYSEYDLFSNIQLSHQKLTQWTMKNGNIFNDVTETLIWYLNIKSGIKTDNDPIKQMFLAFSVVPSLTALSAWTHGWPNLRDNFVEEAFEKWIAPPVRDYSWQLLNSFFINIFPFYYQLSPDSVANNNGKD